MRLTGDGFPAVGRDFDDAAGGDQVQDDAGRRVEHRAGAVAVGGDAEEDGTVALGLVLGGGLGGADGGADVARARGAATLGGVGADEPVPEPGGTEPDELAAAIAERKRSERAAVERLRGAGLAGEAEKPVQLGERLETMVRHRASVMARARRGLRRADLEVAWNEESTGRVDL